MLHRGRGRPRKQVSCSVATLTSSWKVHLRRIGNVLHRKQWNRRRQRILELATANFCSAIIGRRSSLKDLKHFARQLGKRTIRPVHPFCQQRTSGVLEDRKSSPQCVDWNSSETGDIAIFEDILGIKEGESHFDDHVDQWVGVEVLLFGRKSSIGEIGSATSNVCENLRSVVADPEREHLHASFAKRRDEQEGREWPSAEKNGIVPSWVSCRRSITRINASGGISDCHIAALLASLPKMGSHVGGQATTTKNIASIEENGLHPCADEGEVIPIDRSSAAVVTVDQSLAAVIPMAQSFASQESIVNSGKGSSRDFGQEKQFNISVLQRDAIQVCPTTPEKAQKRRRSYQDIIPNHDDRGMDACEPSNGREPTGNLDLRLSAGGNSIKELGGQFLLMDTLMSSYSMDFESSCNSTGIGERGLNVAVAECARSLVDSIQTPAMADPYDNISHVASVIVDPVQESSQLFQTHVPSSPVMEAGDNNVKEFGGRLLLKDTLSPYSVDFEGSCNSARIGKGGPNIAVVECSRSLVESTPTPAIADPFGSISHVACVLVDPLQENSQLIQAHMPSGPVLVVESKKRKEKRAKSILNKDSGGIAMAPKVRKKYKPRVAKVKQTDKSCASRLQNKTDGNAGDRGVSKLARTDVVRHEIMRGGVHKEEIMGSRIGELASEPVTSISPGETLSSIDHTSLARSILEEYMPRPHPHGPFNLGHDNVVSDCLVCGTCGLKRKITSDGSETGQIEQTNNLSSPSEDQMISDSFTGREKYFEALSVALSNRVLALLDLPSIGQPHSLYTVTGEVEKSPPIQSSDVSLCYEEAALKEYPGDGFSSFREEWTAYHAGSAEMTALDAFKEAEMSFGMFYKEQQSAVPEDTLFENECFSAIADTWVRECPCEEDHRGVSSNSQCGLDELCFMQQNSCPVPESLVVQRVSPESEEERTMSSFYASTSAGVNNIMLSRLNEMIEECVQKDALGNENAEQDLNMDVNAEQDLKMNVNAKRDLNMDVRLDCGQTEAPSTCSVQRSAEGLKEVGLLGDHYREEEDLMKMRDTVLRQMRSQIQNPNLDSALATGSVVPAEVNNGLEDCSHNILSADNATLKQTCPRKDAFHLMTFDQLVAYFKKNMMNSSKMSPLKLLCHIQGHLPEDERAGFEKLWPILLHPVNCEQLQKLIDLAELDLPSFIEVIQSQLVKAEDDGAKEDKSLAPCMEVIPYQQKERRDGGAKAHNRMTDIVPFVGNAVVPYDGSFLLRKRKPRPKVNLDNESIRVWKLLMGKTETTESNPDVDNELKWKQERLIMQKQAETFIGRMHLIQGDRSFSRWKGSIVDSVIGVFLTQNVSDVLSSSAYMSLRARFPLGRGPVPSKCGAEGILQNDIEVNPGSFQTCQELQTSCFHEVLSNWAPANENREEILNLHEGCHEKSNTSNLETRQVGTELFLGSENHFPLPLKCQQKESISYTQPEQPPATDTSMNVIAGASELNIHCITNVKNDVEIRRGNEDQEPLTSSLIQGENILTREVVMSSIECQLALSTGIHIQKEVLTGIERARLEAVQVHGRKSSKWNALAEKYNAECQQAAMDAAASPRTEMTEDGVDWEAVRCADLEEIADAIKERGMNWKLAGRIKGFLERLRLEQGAINLEWLRSIPSDDAKEFLTSVHGLGLKSVECIRLLSLHHLAFPVDTNVGRICVRLGWVPLEPLPEELQLHVLELYPVQTTIQKYLWPRLCTLDQQTLYELHYQLITFGKVFCTKSKPNCNACPMRSDCKHFASALASAKLALPPPEESSGSGVTLALPPGSSVSAEAGEEGALSLAKTAQPSMCISQYCQPIIEEPMTPESEADMSEFDIEDFPFSEEEIAHETMMELFIQEIQERKEMQHLDQNSNLYCKVNLSESEIAQEMDMADLETPVHVPEVVNSVPMIVDSEEELGNNCIISTTATPLFNDAPSREVVLLPREAAFIPVPKLKNIERLRTVHYVYELPDNHPLLDGMDVRESDDPCYYLLAIWSPGEVPESIPNINDDNEEIGFTSSSDEENIKATLLVPCRTAMQGSFPLNGTYFQTNEVFADHASSLQPILVPRVLLWNLRRRFVYFGTSVTSIMRGMTTEEIQACFWRGYVCVRGFDRVTRAPKPLVHRLHFQPTKSIVRSASVKNTKT